MLRAHNIPPQASIQASSDLSCNGSNQYLLNVCARCSCSAVGVDKWVAPKPPDSSASPLAGTPPCAVLSSALSRRHNWQAVSLISVQLLWSLNTVLPLFPNTSIMLAKCERHTDVVQWLSLIAHQPKQPLATAGGELPKLLGGGRPTLRIPFTKEKSYAWLDWPLWAWDSGCIALCLMCLKGFSWS